MIAWPHPSPTKGQQQAIDGLLRPLMGSEAGPLEVSGIHAVPGMIEIMSGLGEPVMCPVGHCSHTSICPFDPVPGRALTDAFICMIIGPLPARHHDQAPNERTVKTDRDQDEDTRRSPTLQALR